MDNKTKMKVMYLAYRAAKASGNVMAARKLELEFILASYAGMPR